MSSVGICVSGKVQICGSGYKYVDRWCARKLVREGEVELGFVPFFHWGDNELRRRCVCEYKFKYEWQERQRQRQRQRQDEGIISTGCGGCYCASEDE